MLITESFCCVTQLTQSGFDAQSCKIVIILNIHCVVILHKLSYYRYIKTAMSFLLGGFCAGNDITVGKLNMGV